jgi:dihydrolipoamide dehydrogenase
MDRIIPGMDASLSKELTKVFKKQGMKFYVSHKVQSVERNGDAVTVQAENAKGETITLEGDYALFLLVVVVLTRIGCRECRSEIIR